MNPKKILIIINNLGVGGAERLVIDDINEMVGRGLDVRLLTLKGEFQKTLEKQCLLGDDKKKLLHFTSLFDFKSWKTLIEFIKYTKPDLVISHLWFANTISRIACFWLRIKNIICFEQNVYDSVKTKKMFFVDFILQFFCRKIIAVSETVKKSLIKHGIQEKRVEVIYNSIDLQRYDSATNIRESLSTSHDFIFLFVGRLIHQKGVDILIHAFEKVKNAKLLIVGQGPDKEKLQNIVINKNLYDKVLFLGVRDDIPNLLASVDSFVFPSRHEGFSLVLLEAMASQLAIIITDFPSGAEVIHHDKNGLVVPIDDIEKLAFAMNSLVLSRELQKSLAFQAKKDVQRFSIHHHVTSLLTFLS